MAERDFVTVERMLREGMVDGQMHTCLRDAGRLAGGMHAAGKIKAGDLAALETLATSLSKNKREGAYKWQVAVEYGRKQPVEPDRAPTHGGAYDWNDAIPVRPQDRQRRQASAPAPVAEPVVDERWIEPDEIPAPAADWQPMDMVRYLEAMFDPDEYVGIVTEAWLHQETGRWLPRKGFCDKTRATLVEELRSMPGDLGAVIGDPNAESGAWIRVNPLDGHGVKDANVTAYRHTLIEADSDELGKQLALIRALKLPCSAIVHSGKKSIHALVRVNAESVAQYKERVELLYKVCSENGLKVDTANRNPSRLSRLPGVTRGGRPQYLIDGATGLASWDDWQAWIEDAHDNLPEPQPLSEVFHCLPTKAPELIQGVLRTGHKARLTGSSKAGKSFALGELCGAIAEGREWMGIPCRQGPVLYINLELDSASCFHRFHDIYKALGWKPTTISAIDIWNLRGHAIPLDKLTPRLLRRAAGKGYAAVVIDPIYKLQWGDENDAGDVARFCNQLDKICLELGCAVIDAHHHSKGSQGQKRSIDRGSGSGVFGRDPDAVLDLIELDISEDRRHQLVDALVESNLTELMQSNDMDANRWPKESRTPAKRALETFQSEWPRLAQDAAAATYEAREHAKRMTGWRIEGTLREFAPLEHQRVWFDYPIHRADTFGLLTDAKAQGEEPPWEAQRRAKQDRSKAEAKKVIEAIEAAIDAGGGVGHCTVDQVAAQLGKSYDTAARQIKRHPDLKIKRGLIISKGDANE
jgi:RecA-family ATPase